MAQRAIVTLEDDLDGGPADETVRFTVDGRHYEIDLNAANAARFRQALAPFITRARHENPHPPRQMRTAASRRRSRDIRAWAKHHGINLSERGRIPASITSQYEAATRRATPR